MEIVNVSNVYDYSVDPPSAFTSNPVTTQINDGIIIIPDLEFQCFCCCCCNCHKSCCNPCCSQLKFCNPCCNRNKLCTNPCFNPYPTCCFNLKAHFSCSPHSSCCKPVTPNISPCKPNHCSSNWV